MNNASGKLYGLGLGPGDPELLTLKAYRLLQTVPVVAYPCSEDGTSVARSIVAQWLRSDQVEIPIPLPFRVQESAAPYYDRAALQLRHYLQQGQDVAVLCEGEPMLYGSFMYLLNRLSGHFKIDVIPGISSTLASGSIAGHPLTYGNDILSIFPATLPVQILKTQLAQIDAAIIIKLGRHFHKIVDLLKELGLSDRALYLERISQPMQRILPLATVNPAEVPYWSLILIPSDRIPLASGDQSLGSHASANTLD
ncbi:MAG: precorrin-2 C(20)-methyltransferase [Cyanophyceae cyanobacterium]